MKNFLQNLLMFFALCLCGLIAFQWVRETDLRKNVQKLTDDVHDKMEAIQGLQVTVKRDENEITRLEDLRKQQLATIKTNQEEIANLGKELGKASNALTRADNAIEVYSNAVKQANENILRQNDEIKKQNEDMKTLAEERNSVVKKFNDMANKYNELATQWNKQQEELAKAATNQAAVTPQKPGSTSKK